ADRTKDPAKRRELVLRGCDLGDTSACGTAMKMLDEGAGGPVDHAGARRLQDQLCGQGFASECLALASDARQRGDGASAHGFDLRACHLESGGDGCRAYASALR